MNGFPFKLPLLLDGATGTNLIKAGMPSGVCVEKWVLDNTDVLKDLQKSYVNAGSDALYAPTFGANYKALSKYGFEKEADLFNERLVEITKEISSGKLVGGDMSPTGGMLVPFGDMELNEVKDIYAKQAKALDGKVDFFVCETMMSLLEAKMCVLGIQGVSEKPIFVTMTVDENGNTLMGENAVCCLLTMQSMGVKAFGLNCSVGPDKMVKLIEKMYPFAKVPLIAKPNAGTADQVDKGEYMTPEEFASYTQAFLDAGAGIFGGCCGTGFEHIEKMKAVLKDAKVKSYDCGDNYLCTKNKYVKIDNDTTYSNEIICDDFLADEVNDCNEDVAVIRINNEKDKDIFFENSFMFEKPVSIKCNDKKLLKEIKDYYNGVTDEI